MGRAPRSGTEPDATAGRVTAAACRQAARAGLRTTSKLDPTARVWHSACSADVAAPFPDACANRPLAAIVRHHSFGRELMITVLRACSGCRR